PSGSGKTTAVRMLTGTLRPTVGVVRVLGENPVRFRRRTRERVGYVPQLFVLYPDLSVAENVSFVASLFGVMWWRKRRRVREVLELLELWDVRHRRARDLSGGMQRRLVLATALVHEPRVLFVDEPTAGIDPILRQTIWDELRRLRDQGQTLLVTTQYVGEAEYCDSVALLTQGRLIAYAQPDEMRRSVVGGEALLVETARVADPEVLAEVRGVTAVEQTGPRTLVVRAEDASQSGPDIVEALTRAGNEVASMSEYRPSFDDVFAALVAQDQARRAAEPENARD
ncbi:MAG: ABC transporter ATP-binding protein, partial [Chloroflexota bacterium]|nr:ABC transporter ATP-binding protein [Chloroflexota bacterium]